MVCAALYSVGIGPSSSLVLHCPPTPAGFATGYMVVDYVQNGRMLSETWKDAFDDPNRRKTLFHDLSRIILTLAQTRFPRNRLPNDRQPRHHLPHQPTLNPPTPPARKRGHPHRHPSKPNLHHNRHLPLRPLHLPRQPSPSRAQLDPRPRRPPGAAVSAHPALCRPLAAAWALCSDAD